MPTARLALPFPPTVNNLFATIGRRRVPSKQYAAWRAEAAQMIRQAGPALVAGPVNIRIDLVAPDRRRRDCDNYAKAPLDALVAAGVISDDSAVRRLSIGWEDEGAACTVTITSVERAAEAI